MAKAPQSVQDAVMDAGRLKSVLKLAQAGDEEGNKVRIPIVIALDNDDEGVVSAARRGSPKKLRNDLIKTVQKEGLSSRIKTEPSRLYFGFGYTNDDADGVLQVDLNKQPAGAEKLAAKILRRVRAAGFSEVVFHVNEALESVSEDEEPQAGQDAASPVAMTETAPADFPALTRELAQAIGAIPRSAGADPARKALLAQMASAATAAVKSRDGAEAIRLVGQLTGALSQSAGEAAPATPPAAPPTAMKPDELLALFRDAKDDVDTGLTKLQAALRETGDADLLRIADYGLYGMADGQGVGLMKALFDLRAATPQTRDALFKAARDAAAAYRAAVFSDDAVELVDDNPFGVEVGIKAKLGRALDIIANAA